MEKTLLIEVVRQQKVARLPSWNDSHVNVFGHDLFEYATSVSLQIEVIVIVRDLEAVSL